VPTRALHPNLKQDDQINSLKECVNIVVAIFPFKVTLLYGVKIVDYCIFTMIALLPTKSVEERKGMENGLVCVLK
jgi:hypothetical protein